MAGLMPARVFADSLPEYISEVKVFYGDSKNAEKEGFTVLKGDNGKPADLNEGAGGGWGSKGDKAVYLGYKTTTDRKEAVTDLALMNMKGGYDVAEYDALMETQMKAQIIPFVENFLAAIREYRENVNSPYDSNSLRVQYIRDVLNKFKDDDCGGAGLGDLLLNETKYEMGDEAYNALSDSEKKNHADILTIIAQSNGQATLLMENLITRAADANEDTWLDRLSETSYDDLLDFAGGTPTDATRLLHQMYQDDAELILKQWEDFGEQLDSYDEAVEFLDNYDADAINAAIDAADEIDENTPEQERTEILSAFDDAQNTMLEAARYAEIAMIHDTLDEIDYGDGTMLEFFSMSYEDVEDDITQIYPLVAALSDGQRAGLEFVSLRELFKIALTDGEGYADAELDALPELSIYDGVDRAIYQKGGVALTSDALRSKVEDAFDKEKKLSGWTIAGIVLAGSSLVALAISLKLTFGYYSKAVEQTFTHSCMVYDPTSPTMFKELTTTHTNVEYQQMYGAKNMTCAKISVGLGVAFVVLSAITVYLSYMDMKAYYNVEFTPVPHYMVDEKDIIGYNIKGEKIILKNQSAYYKAAECNRSADAEFYNMLGTCADMNGDVGKQWLALYAVKNEAMEPILASSLRVVVDSTTVPAGYSTGIHMFGSNAAFNLNSSLYDWNNSAKSVFVFFKTDSSVSNTAGSNFTGGTLALTGGAGIALGALATAICVTATKKKKQAA
jgi:hypothetical protein